MFWIGVHPYYLLQCHKERGIVHFITPIQVGKIYMKHLQGWISGITVPRYAANIEGGGGKVLLMPSGHDTLNLDSNIDDKISESFASVLTWDHKKMREIRSSWQGNKGTSMRGCKHNGQVHWAQGGLSTEDYNSG
jgi:lysine 2,3-aminomutase